MTVAERRKAVLFAVPGTTCRDAAAVFDRIGRAAARRFPGVAPRWTFTSGGVRRKLAAQGKGVPTPAEVLTAMHAEGFARVAVMPLHLSDGMEFGELAETVAAHTRGPARFDRITLGTPLLACAADLRRAFAALWASLPEPPGDNEGVVLVAHGSRDLQGRERFGAAAALSRRVDRRLLLGLMIGAPGLDDVARECRAAGFRKVWLLPFMVAAGYSARENLAGAGERSWTSALQRAGIECVPVMKGLGECDAVVSLWMNQVEGLLGDLDERG